MKKTILLLAGFVLAAGTAINASAVAIVETIVWEGICFDCVEGPLDVVPGTGIPTGATSIATATLGVSVLGDGPDGSTDLAENLISFSYASDLYDLTADSVLFAFGEISIDPNSFALSDVFVYFEVADVGEFTFFSQSDGRWGLFDGFLFADFGDNGLFNPAPAPATLALLALGLSGLGLRGRKT